MATPTQERSSGDFVSNLGKIYGLYTGGFFAFVLLLAVLEQIGVPNQVIGYLFVFLTLAVYAFIGILTRTMQVSEYYVAGRRVPAFYNGMATGADWMSAASFVGMAGTLYALGYDGLAFVLGWTGGYVLVAIFVAPYLRKFGAYTVPDFLAERFGGNFTRFLGVLVLVACSFTYVTAQIYGTGIIASRFLGINFEVAVYVGLLGILLCSMLGGMRAVTWTQVAQYIVLIVAYLTPVIILSSQKYGLPIPQFTYADALQDIAAREQEMIQQGLAAAGALKPHIQPFQTYDPLNYFGLIFCLMVGTASLPHILMRYFTTPSVREARSSVAWSLFFIFLLYFTAPAYAAFAKLEIYNSVIGRPLEEIRPWLFTYGELGLVKICGKDALNLEAVKAACSSVAGHPGFIRLQDFSINNDVIVISTPEIAGMPYVIAGLVAAGGLAAALSTADGLLLAIANALSHDVYYKTLDPNAPTGRRLVVARVLLVIVAVAAAYTASTKPGDILAMVAWAFSLAAAGLFPALVMGIWWKRANSAGAIVGIILGFGICLYYLVGTRYFASSFYETWSFLSSASPAAIEKYNQLQQAWISAAPDAKAAAWAAFDKHAQTVANWWGVRNISAALFGLPIGFLAIWIVSLLTPAPSARIQELLDDIRRPRGETYLKEKTA
ncbi:MAG: cation acetate symporter [Rhodomicrobium sp.]|nr:cation acetate symporter [Rhodomicrobium sp.]